MASLRKRNGVYYLVFARRSGGKLQQKAFSLGVTRKRSAETLRINYQERYALGEIDPFNGWSPKAEFEQKRAEQPTGTTLEEMAERFLQSRSHVRAVTRREYRRLLDTLIDILGRTMPVGLLTDQDIRAFCFKPGYSTATQTTYLRFCKMFDKWLHDAGHIDEPICKAIRYPKKNHRVSNKIITEAQLEQVFDTFDSVQRERSARGSRTLQHAWFKPMMATYFYAGLRRREGIELTWDRVDLGQGYLYLSGTKSGRERVVPIRKKLLPHLTAWHRKTGKPRDGLVFFKNQVGERKIPVQADHVSKSYKKYARAAGLPESVNLHGLRHSCATELLRLGMGINEVASILGHSSLEITRIYEHLNERDLKRKMDQLGI